MATESPAPGKRAATPPVSRLSSAPTASAQGIPQSQPLSTLEIAHVLSAEIVGYSTLPMDQQGRLLGRLIRLISQTSEFRRSQTGDQLIGLPTGDGMTLVFFGDPVAPVRCATEIARALQSYPEMKLRIGIHSGPVYRMAGIDARANVAGEGIKTAQRIMSCGDPSHILLSRPVADTLGQLGNWSKSLTDLGEREITPGAKLQLFNLYTGEAGNPELPRGLPATGPLSQTPATAPATGALPGTSKKIRPVLIISAAAIAIAIAVAVAGYLVLNRGSLPEARPLTTTEFAESFMSLENWKTPSSGWSFADQTLRIEDQPALGYAPEVNCADFTMVFSLKLVNDGGAAWGLRVKDPDNYYLFYLSGPGGVNPNTFLTYLVKDGKTVQKQAITVVVHLVAGGQYQISIDAKDNRILHKIKTDNTKPEFEEEIADERQLGLFIDHDNTYPSGSVGFRTLGAEKFVLSALFVRPPGVEMPQ